MPKNQPSQSQIEDRLRLLWFTYPSLTLRIVTIRLMLEHRRIPILCSNVSRVDSVHPDDCRCLCKVIRRSKEFVYGTLRGSALANPDAYTMTSDIEVLDRRLEEIEDGITLLTDKAGGIIQMCGCTPDAIEQLTLDLKMMPTTLETFNMRSGNTVGLKRNGR